MSENTENKTEEIVNSETTEVTTEVVNESATNDEAQDTSQEQAEEEEQIEWSQTRLQAENTETANNGDEVQALKVRIVELENQLSQTSRPEYQPMLKALSSYFDANPEGDISSFLNQLKGISPLSQLSPEQKIERYYTMKAEKLGLKGDKLEQAVEQKLSTWQNKDEIDQYEELQVAEKELGQKNVSSIDDLESEYQSVADKNKVIFQKWSNDQIKNVEIWLDKKLNSKTPVVNGRKIDKQWALNILEKVKTVSPTDLVVEYAAEKHETGINNIFVPELIERLDRLYNWSEIKDVTKSKIVKAKTENVVEQAASAQAQSIAAEKISNKTEKEKFIENLVKAQEQATKSVYSS
jgi:hypothetical protein